MKKSINPTKETWGELLQRPTQTIADIEATVHQIFTEIKDKGDVAVSKYTQLFDGITLNNMVVSTEEIESAVKSVSEELKQAIKLAKNNITKFHEAQKSKPIRVETMDGVQCWQEKRPIEKVGLYIPGGSAPLFSTILMLAVPANLAGCKEVFLCTPPDKNGSVHPAILYTAQLCGVQQIYKIGGIQAIAAMTFGTETVPCAYKLFGPGNQFVTVAKQIATKFGVAIDMPAGPSELMVFADDTANAAFVASDLLSQAEHGADSQVILVSTSLKMLEAVETQLSAQIQEIPRRDIAKEAIANSKLILVNEEQEALAIINEYGPEHLIIVAENESFFTEGVSNAGSVFLGSYTPESVGDYASGTNHTLPTNGFAKQYSGVNLDSFLKAMTFQKISKKGMASIGKAVEIMAESEGLMAHKNAVSLRLKELEDE